jgi:selenophosphate synthetase-related protein
MELLATGADPISITGTFAVEPEPTGNQILRGIVNEVRYAGIGYLPILCSSEKNVRVSQTSVGVTVLGSLTSSRLMIGRCRPGDELVAIGEPRVRDEVLVGARRRLIADTKDVCRLRKLSFVHEIIPVGSKGILHEARILAKESKLSLTLASSHIDLEKSAGPSTVLLCAIPSGCLDHVKRIVSGKPTSTIGHFHSR